MRIIVKPKLLLMSRWMATVAVAALMAAGPARADRIKHPIAVFSGLDKITGRTIAFEAALGETVQFGSLQITDRACYTRPATEAPQTISFIEVDEVDADKKYKRVFSGWMFAASPGLHGIEHPIYDVWLTGCRGGHEAEPSPPPAAEAVPRPATSPAVDAADVAPPARKGRTKKRDAVTEEQMGEAPAVDRKEALPPPARVRASKNRASQAEETAGEAEPEPQNLEAPSLGAPIEVGRPPGFIPVPRAKGGYPDP